MNFAAGIAKGRTATVAVDRKEFRNPVSVGDVMWRASERRRIKTQTVLPSAGTAAMLFWALLASGQINMRKVDGWQRSP